jgi:hypothetical protein
MDYRTWRSLTNDWFLWATSPYIHEKNALYGILMAWMRMAEYTEAVNV